MMKCTAHWKLSVTVSLLLVAGMTAAAKLTHHHEIFFPELLALCVGCFWMEARPWRTTGLRTAAGLSAGSLAGFLICLLPWSVPLKMIALCGFCGVFLTVVRINLTPMFSACLLPVLLGGASWLYPVCIAAESLIVCGLEALLTARGLRMKTEYAPPEGTFPARLARQGIRVGLLALLLPPLLAADPFLCAPPLIVAFFVFSDLARPARKHIVLGALFCIGAAFAGVLTRRAGLLLNIPPELLIPFPVLLFAWGCRAAGYFLPPAGAILLLAFLIPESALNRYLLMIPAGTVVFLFAGRMLSLAEETEAAAVLRSFFRLPSRE